MMWIVKSVNMDVLAIYPRKKKPIHVAIIDADKGGVTIGVLINPVNGGALFYFLSPIVSFFSFLNNTYLPPTRHSHSLIAVSSCKSLHRHRLVPVILLPFNNAVLAVKVCPLLLQLLPTEKTTTPI